jgi:eukaryotic-like serine/threonine-protein kinase
MPGAPLEAPPPDRELWPWLLVLLALVLVGLGAAYFATRDKHKQAPVRTVTTVAQTVAPLTQRTTPKPAVEATVPKVVGLQAPAALKALTQAGLTGKTRGVFSDHPKNQVVKQEPESTTKVKKGAAVELQVSKGKESVPVPDVVGQNTAAALETVKAQGFAVRIVRVPSDLPAGQVVAQAPAAGKNAPGDSTVRLNVSDGSGGATTTAPATTAASKPTPGPGPREPAKVTVPDVRGLKLLAARRQIRRAGLVTEFKRVPSNEPKGTVLGESPKPGETKKKGDHVRVTVSLGPKPSPGAPPTVPDVTGEDETTARHDLEEAGFTVTVVDQDTSDPSEDGIVIDQSPGPGASASARSQVTIYVSRYTGG